MVAGAEGEADRLLGEFQQLADRDVDRHGPLLVFPVVGRFAVDAEGGAGFRRVRPIRI
jgi:hypothetical protein